MFNKTLLIVCLFCIAMAALEGAVVVYLRALYYPEGFTVAFKMIGNRILLTEMIRELATVVMLVSLGLLAGNVKKDKFAYFLISFAIWDIFYYIWLKIFIGWPNSLLDWDILFLIPFVWLGPVLAPVICSITMLFLASVLLIRNTHVGKSQQLFLILGTFFILYSFMEDYGYIIFSNGFYKDFFNLPRNSAFIGIVKNYIPQQFNWLVWGLGELLIITTTLWIKFKARKLQHHFM